jgi:hypothetical protein
VAALEKLQHPPEEVVLRYDWSNVIVAVVSIPWV